MRILITSPNLHHSAAAFNDRDLFLHIHDTARVLACIRARRGASRLIDAWTRYELVERWVPWEGALAFYHTLLCWEGALRPEKTQPWLPVPPYDVEGRRYSGVPGGHPEMMRDVALPPWIGDPDCIIRDRGLLMKSDPDHYGRMFEWLDGESAGEVAADVSSVRPEVATSRLLLRARDLEHQLVLI